MPEINVSRSHAAMKVSLIRDKNHLVRPAFDTVVWGFFCGSSYSWVWGSSSVGFGLFLLAHALNRAHLFEFTTTATSNLFPHYLHHLRHPLLPVHYLSYCPLKRAPRTSDQWTFGSHCWRRIVDNMTDTLQSRVVYLFCPSLDVQVNNVAQVFTLQRVKGTGKGSRRLLCAWIVTF